MKNEHQRAVDSLLEEARSLSGGDPSWAITYLMAAAIYLQQQIGLSKKDFLSGATVQWNDINLFLAQTINVPTEQ